MSILSTLYPHLTNHIDATLSSQTQDLSSLPDYPASQEELIRVIASLPTHFHALHNPNTIAVILAAGKGSRMGDTVPQKTLSPILGKPALLHLIEICQSNGIQDFIFVVGYGYKSVIQTVEPCGIRCSFLFQDEALGTGHAARYAARFLKHQKLNGEVLVLMGDKWISEEGLKTLLDTHQSTKSTLTMTVGRKEDWEESGRVVFNDAGDVTAIIEKADIVKIQMIQDFLFWDEDPVRCKPFLETQFKRWNRKKKLEKLMGSTFWNQLNTQEVLFKKDAVLPGYPEDSKIAVNESVRLSGDEIESLFNRVNLSVYVFENTAFYDAMEGLDNINAQGEYYLTDAVQYLTASGKISAAEMPNRYDIMGFNTPKELAFIEKQINKTISA